MPARRTLRLRSDDLEWRDVEGRIVALDVRASMYISVNRTGAALWPHLAEGASQADLEKVLVEAFGVDAVTARRDVDAFVTSLRERGLLAAGRFGPSGRDPDEPS